jgi:ribosome biogenesis GTPase
MQHVYQEIGYQCLRVSSTEMKGIDKLKELIGKASILWTFRSWESTLVNAMEPSCI